MGKTYFISGANRGIGLQLAIKLAQQDSTNTVIATARDFDNAIDLKDATTKYQNIHAIKLDISSKESINGIDDQISQLVSDKGIDVYISNGGLGDTTSTRSMDRQSYIDHFVTNVVGPLQIVNILHKYLIKTSTRQIFFVTSVAGRIGSFFPILTGAYGITKAALNHSAL